MAGFLDDIVWDPAGLSAAMRVVGVTRRALAGMCGVDEWTVGRWLNPHAPQEPPERVRGLLAGILDRRRGMVREAEEDVAKGSQAGRVLVAWYRNQAAYDRVHADGGDWQVADADSLAVADVYQAAGYEVEFRYMGEEEE